LEQRIPKNHPRLYVRPEKKHEFVTHLKTKFPTLHQSFLENADRWMKQPVIQSQPGTSNAPSSHALFLTVSHAVETATNLAFAYLITGEPRYGTRAKEWADAIVSWPPTKSTSFNKNPNVALVILQGVARIYSWASPFFTQQERETLMANVKWRGQEIYTHLRTSQFCLLPYNTKNMEAWPVLGQAGIAFFHEIPAARDWVGYAMTIQYTMFPVWGGNQGGWHEGIPHWNNYMDKMFWWLDAIDAAFRVNGYRLPFFQQTGDFAMYLSPPGAVNAGFGDYSNQYPALNNGKTMAQLAAKTQNPYWLWYAAKSTPQLKAEEITYKEALRAVAPEIKPQPPREIPSSRLFPDVGIAALHRHIHFPEGDTYLLFKSSPYGTQSQGYDAQNSFVLFSRGEPLLINSGLMDRYDSPHHKQWMWDTASTNSFTIDGQGQIKHSPHAMGRITGNYFSEIIDYVAGEASNAYNDPLESFTREIFFVKTTAMIVLDELKAAKPVVFESHLHSPNPFDLKNQYNITVADKKAAARIAFATPADLIVQSVSTCTPPSPVAETNQWHLTAKTPEKRTEATFITFILPHESGREPDLYAVRRALPGYDILNIKLQTIKLSFLRKTGTQPLDSGMIKTDASRLLIMEHPFDPSRTNILAVGATYFTFKDRTIRQADTPSILFIPKEDMPFEVKEEETKEQNEEEKNKE
ncbi:DUF4962 domain-containing protein, partial [bacterium]|nr:DUF4962 domain-containing protein [bacterium]